MNKNKKIKIMVIITLILILTILAIVMRYNKLNNKIDGQIEEKYKVIENNNKYGISDSVGNVLISAKYYAMFIPNPSKAIFVCYYDYDEQTNTYRSKVINDHETELFSKYNNIDKIDLNEVDTTMPYEKNVLKFKEYNKYGLIDLKGNLITKPIYDSIEGLISKEGELLVSKEGKYGVINTKGVELIDCEYDYIAGDGYHTQEKQYSLSGYILGEKNDNGYRYGYMTYKRKIILDIEYNDLIRIGGMNVEDSEKDIFLIAQKDGQYGLIKNKKIIIDFKFQSIDYSGIGDLFIVKRNTKNGVYSSIGKKIISVKFDEVEVHETYIYTKLGESEAYYNLLGNRIDKSTIEE